MSDIDASAAATAPTARGGSQHHEAISTALPGRPQEGHGEPRSLGKDAWLDLRTNPIFLISATLIVVLLTMAMFPGLFTSQTPESADLTKSRVGPSSQAWFGYDLQGNDIYTLTVYGARASIMVGVLATTITLLLGSLAGIVAGYAGGWVDSVISRLTDVFYAIPLLLGAILVVFAFPTPPETPSIVIILRVVAALAILGWTPVARIMRSSVIGVKQADYVQAARALGASPVRIVLRHILPNAVAPVIVVSTIALGGYIAVEATLSFLGLGLTPPVVSWGVAISEASTFVRVSPHMLLFPSLFLSITVLAFIMLGDAVRDALDPKLR